MDMYCNIIYFVCNQDLQMSTYKIINRIYRSVPLSLSRLKSIKKIYLKILKKNIYIYIYKYTYKIYIY